MSTSTPQHKAQTYRMVVPQRRYHLKSFPGAVNSGRAAIPALEGLKHESINLPHGAAFLTEGKTKAMTYVIVKPCNGVKDKSCIDICPMDCIHGTDALLPKYPDRGAHRKGSLGFPALLSQLAPQLGIATSPIPRFGAWVRQLRYPWPQP